MSKNNGGRPKKISKTVVDELCKYLAAGNTRKDSCAMVGISVDTFARYMNEPPRGFADFAERIARAEAVVIARAVATVVKAGSGKDADWRAAAWLLERKRPEQFRERKQLDVSKLDDETLLRALGAAESEGAT